MRRVSRSLHPPDRLSFWQVASFRTILPGTGQEVRTPWPARDSLFINDGGCRRMHVHSPVATIASTQRYYEQTPMPASFCRTMAIAMIAGRISCSMGIHQRSAVSGRTARCISVNRIFKDSQESDYSIIEYGTPLPKKQVPPEHSGRFATHAAEGGANARSWTSGCGRTPGGRSRWRPLPQGAIRRHGCPTTRGHWCSPTSGWTLGPRGQSALAGRGVFTGVRPHIMGWTSDVVKGAARPALVIEVTSSETRDTEVRFEVGS